MKKKRLAAVLLGLSLVASSFNLASAQAAEPKPTSVKLTVSSKTAYAGSEFELRTKTTPTNAEDDYLVWSITGKSGIIKFEDSDRTGDEMEFIALKKGTTTVQVKIKGTDKKDTVKVTVKDPVYLISRVGAKTRSVTAGDKFELEVRKIGSIKNKNLKWSIGDKSIVKFVSTDLSDDDVELKALKAGTTTVKCKNLVTGGSISYKITVKKVSSSSYITRIGSANRTVEVDDDIELKVRKGSALSASQIKWTIKDTSILRFDDGDNVGTAVEVEGRKVGTTTVTAKNLKTGGKLVFTVKVVPEVDD